MHQVLDVSDLQLAFGGNTDKLLPPMDEIPDEFKYGRNSWVQLVEDWFYTGVESIDLVLAEGTDRTKAMRHLRACLVSFEPKHEHKMAGVAYLMSQWFKKATWKRNGKTKTAGEASGA